MVKDTFYNLSILANLTRSCTTTAIRDRIQGHTVQYDECDNIFSVDGRRIAYHPDIFFFEDCLDLDGQPDEYTEDHRRLLSCSYTEILKPLVVVTGDCKLKERHDS